MDAVLNFFVNTNEANKKLTAFKKNVEEIKKSIVGKLGAFGTALFGAGAIREVYQQTKALSNLSDKFNLPIDEVSKFNNILSMFGGSTEATINSLSGLEQAITELRTTGGGALKQVAQQIGLSLFDSQGQIKNSIDLIQDLRQKFKGLNEDAKLKVSQELGIGDAATLRLLKASDKEYADMLTKSKQMSVVDERTKQTVLAIHRTLASMKQTLLGIGAVLLQNLEKPLQIIANWFNKFNSLGEDTKKIIVAVATAFISFYPAIGIISQIITLFKCLFVLVSTNPIITIIAAIVAGLLLLYKNCEIFKQAINSFLMGLANTFDWIMNKFKKLSDLWDRLTFKKKKAVIELDEECNRQQEELSKKGVGDYEMAINKFMPSKNMINQSTVNNNQGNSSTIKNTFTINLSTAGNVREAESMLNRVIRQNATGVR